jgi:transposase
MEQKELSLSRRPTAKDKKEVIALVKQGVHYKDIAEKLSLTPGQVGGIKWRYENRGKKTATRKARSLKVAETKDAAFWKAKFLKAATLLLEHGITDLKF